MRTLFLMRHGEANITFPDEERLLTSKGRKGVQKTAQLLDSGLLPQLICVSTSCRTKETSEILVNEKKIQSSILFDNELYLASKDKILHFIESLPNSIRNIMIIAHNPGLSDFIAELNFLGRDHTLPKGVLLPPASIVVLQYDINNWADLIFSQGKLIAFLMAE